MKKDRKSKHCIMNPQKKPRTSLYSDQLTKHWSHCSAGFEDLPSSNRSSTKESQKKKFKYEGWGDRWEEEEEEKEEEVDIVWSSSSEDEDTGVKGIRILNTLSHKSGTVTIKSAASGKSAGRPLARKKSSRHGKAAMASGNNMSWDARDTSLEDSIIGDSSSDEDNRESPRKSGVQVLKDGSPPRTETRTVRVEGVGVHEGPQRKEKETTPSARARTGNIGKASNFVDRGRRQYIQRKQDSFEPEIFDYDSPSEEESPSVSEVMISEPSSASQSSWSRGHPNTSTTTTSPKSNPMGSPRTGSEWVKKLKLQASITPERSAGAGEDTRGAGSASGGAGAGIVDSARKKKKFVSSGLAERLQRLVSREKSSIAMWYHNQADSQNSQQEPTKSGLVVKILSCETHRGLYLTYCVTQVSSKSKFTDGSKVKGGGDQAGCSQGDEMYVFFTRSTGDQLGLAKDMLISIHTPWQKLSVPDVSKPVVLCTYFCRPVNLDHTDVVQHQPNLPECPTESSKSPKVLNPVRLFPSTVNSHSPSADIAPTQENKAKNISASIMQSVSETGACSSSGISFKATVQRIVTRRQQTVVPHQSARVISSRNSLQAQASSSLIKSLLLQDREGVVCEVQLTNQMAESTTWQQVLQSGEGRSYIFMNLRVTQRLTLARAPGLSSMIRSLQQHHPDQVSGQTVCYVLTSELGMTAVEAIEQSESAEVPPHKPPAVMDLCNVVQNTQTPKKRTSFSATPILLSPTSPDYVIPSSGLRDTPNNPGSWFLFLSTSAGLHHHHSTAPREESTSHSCGPDKYVRLHMHQSNVLGEEVLMRLKNGGNRTRIFCRDILVTSTQDGVFLNADGFSYISTEDDSEVKSMPDIVLSVLKISSRLHSLVRISGNICGVEEETAFSWPACPQCGNNQLDGGEGSGFVLHCSQCNKDVNSPLIRMHLIVLLTYPTLPSECTVKVQLLQSTIESILPSPSSQASGGHDLQSILGVLIGPMNCLVRTVSESSERKVFLLEEVLLLNCGFAGTVEIV